MSRESANQSAPPIYSPYWDYCVVEIEIVDKQRFGWLGKDSMTLAKWIAKLTYQYAPTFAEQLFTADTRQGEDYNERKANTLGDFLLQLEQSGWEIMDNSDISTTSIYLAKPKHK